MKTLILVDIQNDFLPGGALAVPEGDVIVPIVNRLLPGFDLVVATQDWHPADHGSFAANHAGKNAFETIDLNGLSQTLWPVHCVQNTGGACFAPGLDTRHVARVFPKGTDARVDSYSGFFDNGRRSSTGMAEWLKERGARDLWVCGLATDFCVKFTALDAIAEGFRVHLITDACRGIDLPSGNVAAALAEMQAAGVRLVTSQELP
jgi:nicotinamidase/pyrazinamidase